MNIESLVRPNIRALSPYRSARQDRQTGVLLDANENSFGSVLSANGRALHRYPDPFQVTVRRAFAEHERVGVDQVFAGVGSDEAIDLLLRVFCRPSKDRVLIPEPTYGMYRVAASIQDAIIDTVPLDDTFQIDRQAVAAALQPNTKLVFVCSPNNPTGNLLRTEDILWLCREAPGLVVVDEAYIEFAHSASLTTRVADLQNLVVLRTLSKAWGLASIRLGYAVAHPTVVSFLLKVKPPYNVNGLTSVAAVQALQNADAMERMVLQAQRERERLRWALASSSLVDVVLPSDANFLAVCFREAETVRQALLRSGIIVRDRSKEPKLAGCLRITIGTPEENDALLQTLRSLE